MRPSLRHAACLAALCVPLLASGAATAKDRDLDRNSHASALWTSLADPVLQDLRARMLEDNPDLLAARARVWQSEASRRATLSKLLPTLSLDVNENTTPFGSLGFQFGGIPRGPGQEIPDFFSSGSAMINARLGVDLWGQRWLNYRASSQEVRATELDWQQQSVLLSAQLASAYYDAVTASGQSELLQQQLHRNQSLLEVLQGRFETGSASALDVLQQRQQVAASRARIAPVESQVQTSRLRLAELVGLPTLADLPPLPPALPELAPPTAPNWVQVAQGRPDVRAAELRMQANQDRASSAVRGLLPTVQLSGRAGVEASYADDLHGQNTWSVSAGLSWPVDITGQQHALIAQQEATAKAASAQHLRKKLAARYETQRALSLVKAQHERLRALAQQAQAARRTYDEARERYLAGMENYLSVIASLAALDQSELSLLLARRDQVAAYINLYQALGVAPSSRSRS